MTTDTAVRVTRMVVQDRSRCQLSPYARQRPGQQCAAPVDKIPYLDHPELKINKNESTQMPFRYVKGEDGLPIMPEVRLCLCNAL